MRSRSKTDNALRRFLLGGTRLGWKTNASLLTVIFLLQTSYFAQAGEVTVEKAESRLEADGRYRFDVTLRHGDEGWDHYADRWDILSPDGEILGTRVLLHPHVNEQPFTRSLTGVDVPAGIAQVRIRAHDSIHGYGPQEAIVALPDR